MGLESSRLDPEKLFKKCDKDLFEFETTENVPPLEGIIGQERAVRAMDFGLKINRHGYNIFMTGLTGTGKISYARSVIEEAAGKEAVPDDWCYLYNFKDPGAPLALNLPAGSGSVFVRNIDRLLDDFKEVIPKTFKTEDYERQKAVLFKDFQEKRSSLMEELNKVALEYGFVIKRSGTGFLSVPTKEGKELSEEEYNQLDPKEREELEQKSTDVQIKAMDVLRRIQNEEKRLKDAVRELEHKTGLHAVGPLIEGLKEEYKDFPLALQYLEDLQEDVLENLSDFKEDDDAEEKNPFPWFKSRGQETATKYKVNLVVDNKETKGAPVIVESNPTYYNLIGRVEYENRMGMVTTDFTMIKGGALHRANGGYLILQAKDILLNFQSWEVLKRVLKTKEIRIETIGEQYALITMASLKPKAIPLSVKVVLIGNPMLYHLLYRLDDDFRKLFKIKVDFDVEMTRSLDNMSRMANFVSTNCHEEGLKHFDRSGVGRIVEHSSRLAEHQDKMTTCFNDIVEVIYEADTWAEQEGAPYVAASHVEKAIAEKTFRSDKYEKKLLELVAEGHILLELEGAKEGQINGLSIIDLGDYAFARPSRITSAVYLGRRGIVNIERESKMSGRIHDKGVLIISGYLGQKYAQDFPLTVSASLCFEQAYNGIEGDSASSAELYALLSSISGLPLKQGLAVTGSVNQKGEIQPVGGITRKIEGFFAACKLAGLSGQQGVLIPHQNITNLMLNKEVVEAVKEGVFHIYAVKTVDEGMELLTSVSAGEKNKDGFYPSGTVNYLVEKKLREYNDFFNRQPDKQDFEEETKNNGREGEILQ